MERTEAECQARVIAEQAVTVEAEMLLQTFRLRWLTQLKLISIAAQHEALSII